ncbi:MAG TPA: EamA family transporter [Gemmatimonadales bacterium]|jgi:drug/metabolite transporter (DMT)-like permease|nr:EamA family transporter [Gemmatimonadales bacterium]
MPYLLALASAILYGAADFTGGAATRLGRTIPVVFLSQVSGLVLLALLLPLLPNASPSRGDLLWGAAAGLTGGAGVALLYRALAIGRMAVVAPTTAVCAVAIPVLVSVLLGERPVPMAVAGIILGVVSIVLVSQQRTAETGTHGAGRAKRLPPGMAIALVSGVGIGLFFLSLAQSRSSAGMWPILVARALSSMFFGVAALTRRESLRMPPRVLVLVLVCGVIDMSANALYLLAARQGPLSVVVTLSSLYPASTVLLARVVLGERLNALQITGVAGALGAIVLIVSGGRS